MPSRNFDERYPAMFQPGGDMPGAPAPEETAHTAESAANGPALALSPVAHRAASSDTGPPWRWLVPAGAAVLMIAAGVATLTVQYWLPSSMEMDPSKFQGIELQPWGQVVFAASPALVVTGIGILAALLLLSSRHQAAREHTLRIAFAAVAVAAGVAGWVGIFTIVLFPGTLSQWSNGGMNAAMPWTYLVGSIGTWLFATALFMLAVLFIVPRRWQQSISEAADSGGRPSSIRGLWFGAAVAAAGMFALFAPYLFPLATGIVIVELADGGQATHQGWASMAQNLVPPLLLVGFLIVGWALLSLVITPRRGPAAELDGSGVGHSSEDA